MPRLSLSVPKYRKHRGSGQAVVTLAGVDHYLGPHGSDKSIDKYDRLIAEFLANGRRATVAETITINVLASGFLEHAKTYYVKEGKPTTELGEFKSVMRVLCRMYGNEPVSSFGPMALKACRSRWIDDGLTRQTINKRQGRLVRIFKWGVAMELVDAAVWHALQSVETIHVGRTEIPEMQPVPPVDVDRVKAVLPCVSPTVRAMIGLQLLSGMRPGEVCRLRPCDIDRSGDVWEFTVQGHKTVHHGKVRTVYMGPEAQAILMPFLLRGANDHCFSAAESREWWRAKAADDRKTEQNAGNARGRRSKPRNRSSSTRVPRAFFDSSSYGKAIAAGCLKAWPVPEEIADDKDEAKAWIVSHRWAPNQLRHTRGTQVRKLFGLDAAQVILGHSKADVTQIYAEADRQRAIEISRQIG